MLTELSHLNMNKAHLFHNYWTLMSFDTLRVHLLLTIVRGFGVVKICYILRVLTVDSWEIQLLQNRNWKKNNRLGFLNPRWPQITDPRKLEPEGPVKPKFCPWMIHWMGLLVSNCLGSAIQSHLAFRNARSPWIKAYKTMFLGVFVE